MPLFEFDIDNVARHYRNADYWLNCAENIDDLEDGDRELIYLPIANYKIVKENATGQEESTSLDSFERDVKAIRKIQQDNFKGNDDDFEFPMIVGVRRKDCSKLDGDTWTSWEDYKKDF